MSCRAVESEVVQQATEKKLHEEIGRAKEIVVDLAERYVAEASCEEAMVHFQDLQCSVQALKDLRAQGNASWDGKIGEFWGPFESEPFLTTDGWVSDGKVVINPRYVRRWPTDRDRFGNAGGLFGMGTRWVPLVDCGFREETPGESAELRGSMLLHNPSDHRVEFAASISTYYFELAKRILGAAHGQVKVWGATRRKRRSSLRRRFETPHLVAITCTDEYPALDNSVMVIKPRWPLSEDGIFRYVSLAEIPDVVLLAIKAKYADLIFDGSKTVEFRRGNPFRHKPPHALIYVPSPVCRVRGYFKVGQVSEGTPRELWQRFGDAGGISKANFEQYYQQAATGYAIEIQDVFEFPSSLTLADSGIDGRPPQSFKYVPGAIFEQITAKFSCNAQGSL